jgi:hypothetical protein
MITILCVGNSFGTTVLYYTHSNIQDDIRKKRKDDFNTTVSLFQKFSHFPYKTTSASHTGSIPEWECHDNFTYYFHFFIITTFIFPLTVRFRSRRAKKSTLAVILFYSSYPPPLPLPLPPLLPSLSLYTSPNSPPLTIPHPFLSCSQ